MQSSHETVVGFFDLGLIRGVFVKPQLVQVLESLFRSHFAGRRRCRTLKMILCERLVPLQYQIPAVDHLLWSHAS